MRDADGNEARQDRHEEQHEARGAQAILELASIKKEELGGVSLVPRYLATSLPRYRATAASRRRALHERHALARAQEIARSRAAEYVVLHEHQHRRQREDDGRARHEATKPR